ncbi:WxL domain-containing protein [Lapidilactobacillus achengensis]|uniref:WxL domain-containing protein n=1 Tax=Lapidilactobacillus achengensis TaxID=2486000 RepID=A0ABW1UT94_9LACO|nr:WxL domain-containing protein [Lapidilactobacillus achengensis]
MKKWVAGLVTSAAVLGALALAPRTAKADTTTSTSTASFSVTDLDPKNADAGILEIKSAPSFAFGEVPGADIYGGFTGKPAAVTGDLNISDTRLGSSNWTLSAALTPFATTNTPAKSLTGAEITLAGVGTTWPSFTATKVADSSQPVSLATSDGTTHGDYSYSFDGSANTLALSANPKAILAKGDTYSAGLTWTLTSNGPTAPTATPAS